MIQLFSVLIALLNCKSFSFSLKVSSFIARNNNLKHLPSRTLVYSTNQDDDYYVDPNTVDEFFPSAQSKLSREEEEELLRKYKLERIATNDRWQSCLFRDNHVGEWEGSFELFELPRELSKVQLEIKEVGTVDSIMNIKSSSSAGVVVNIQETYRNKKGVLTDFFYKPIHDTLEPSDYRRESGSLLVGDAYTLGMVIQDENKDKQSNIPKYYIADLAIRDGFIRTRCRFIYSNNHSNLEESTNVENKYDLYLQNIILIKESLRSAAAADTIRLLDDTPGPGIYDPQGFGSNYCTIDLPGRISLMFPRGLRQQDPPSTTEDNKAPSKRELVTLCMLWETSKMRIQADRKFSTLSPAIYSLEVTEILPSDAENYVIVDPPAAPEFLK